MKKILLLILLVLISGRIFAQSMDSYEEYLDKFGVKLGANISSISSNPDDPNYKTAVKFPYLGMFSVMQMSKMFGLEFELGYSLLGADYSLYSNADPVSISLGYITLGALFQVYPVEQLGLNINLGLQYGYLVYAVHDDLDRMDNYKGSDFDILAGVGYNFDFGLLLEVRYLFGLTNISNLQDVSSPANIKNSAIQLMTGWRF